jgi:3-hydroxyisobutyrate dehydrogenase-like beta-hydroxyacid dehydrogenase
MKIGLLHPGAMGVTAAATLRNGGHEVVWVSDGRSRATRERAEGLIEVPTISEFLAEVDHIVSVCPPASALDLAKLVARSGFGGLYIDANAISPENARAIAREFDVSYVDGGIVGPPARKSGTTRLYLSGGRSEEVAGWFREGPLEAISIGAGLSTASALKMCYAAYTKGTSALLLAVRALAAKEGVAEALASEWALSQPDLNARLEGTARRTAPKAWRFEGEMREIASTFEAADLPGGFHSAAGEIFLRMAELKTLDAPTLEDVLVALLDPADR